MFQRFMAALFNAEAASQKSLAGEIVQILNIQEGTRIADIGAGGGYFTFLFSQKAGPAGTVYAVDINADFLAYVQKQAERNGARNIVTVLAPTNALPLPDAGMDLVFLRDVYHHLPDAVGYCKELYRVLKPGGRVAVIDYKKRWYSPIALFGHATPEEAIVRDLGQCGFAPAERFGFLPHQSFTVFKK
jgi:ubiquinone/menaquinone biosynthesis C-methylase UbiE